jgi:hypothetical protein
MKFQRIGLIGVLVCMTPVGVTAKTISTYNLSETSPGGKNHSKNNDTASVDHSFDFVEKRKREGVNLSQHLPILQFLLGLFGSGLLCFFACLYGMRLHERRLSQPLSASKSATIKRGD